MEASLTRTTVKLEQVAAMDASAFFTRFAALLPGNAPAHDDQPILAKIQKVGIVVKGGKIRAS